MFPMAAIWLYGFGVPSEGKNGAYNMIIECLIAGHKCYVITAQNIMCALVSITLIPQHYYKIFFLST